MFQPVLLKISLGKCIQQFLLYSVNVLPSFTNVYSLKCSERKFMSFQEMQKNIPNLHISSY